MGCADGVRWVVGTRPCGTPACHGLAARRHAVGLCRTALALQTISEQLRNGRPIRIEIRQATFGQAPTSLAILTFTHLLPEGEQETLAFDPTRNSAPGVTLSPGWLTALRRGAYRGSRQGRRDD
ncbi:hypothetical protein [Mycolicibacterium tokaiense]|uniref:hypothetical protein n=1 Tax=Mycolicibacterium tokaiense TaxID=39695 RepID=UPI00138C7FCD|nr:hypothetical protein [Mycolicibacterium tokaiense]BBY86264.1 hypothetical protein MTOK_20460 [Mycolicibacterium tokaiense]